MTSLAVILCFILLAVTTTADVPKSLIFGPKGGDYVRFPFMGLDDNNPLSTQFSLCFWAKLVSPNTHGVVWSFIVDGRTGSYSYVHPGYYNRIVSDTSLDYGHSTLSGYFHEMPRHRWTHFCYTWVYDRSYKVFLNGKHIATSTGSTGRSVGSGNMMLGNDFPNPDSRFAFGGELSNLNMFGKELSDSEISRLYEGGPCYVDPSTDAYRGLKWEDILTFNRTGNVTEIELIEACEVGSSTEVIDHNWTEQTDLEVTRMELTNMKITLEETRTKLKETETQLKAANDRLNNNKTESSAGQSGAQQDFTATAHWDILYLDKYLNRVLTDESFAALKSEWDMLEDFIGLNITENIIRHMNEYHGHTKREAISAWEVLDDFAGGTVTEKVIKHLEKAHVIRADEDCNNPD